MNNFEKDRLIAELTAANIAKQKYIDGLEYFIHKLQVDFGDKYKEYFDKLGKDVKEIE